MQCKITQHSRALEEAQGTSDSTACTFCHDELPAEQQLHFVSTKALFSQQDLHIIDRATN